MKSVLSIFQEYGILVSISGPDKIELAGLSKLDPDKYQRVLSYAKEKKPEIIRALAVGNCEPCPASGFWDYSHYAGKRLCFYNAVFEFRSGKPEPCEVVKLQCPRSKEAKKL
jgi:hypothetical protein